MSQKSTFSLSPLPSKRDDSGPIIVKSGSKDVALKLSASVPSSASSILATFKEQNPTIDLLDPGAFLVVERDVKMGSDIGGDACQCECGMTSSCGGGGGGH